MAETEAWPLRLNVVSYYHLKLAFEAEGLLSVSRPLVLSDYLNQIESY